MALFSMPIAYNRQDTFMYVHILFCYCKTILIYFSLLIDFHSCSRFGFALRNKLVAFFKRTWAIVCRWELKYSHMLHAGSFGVSFQAQQSSFWTGKLTTAGCIAGILFKVVITDNFVWCIRFIIIRGNKRDALNFADIRILRYLVIMARMQWSDVSVFNSDNFITFESTVAGTVVS